MEIVKIILISLIVAFVVLYLKKYSPETALLASVAGGLIIIFLIAEYLVGFTDNIKQFFTTTKIDANIIKIIIKITILAYIVEFSASAIRDLGENSLAEKVLLAGKIAILSLSFPIIQSLFTLVSKIVGEL